MDDLPKASRTVAIPNEEGLHLRAASLLVQLARRFQSRVDLVKDDHRADGKSTPLQLIALGAQQGEQVLLEAAGPDAEAAVAALAGLIEKGFVCRNCKE